MDAKKNDESVPSQRIPWPNLAMRSQWISGRETQLEEVSFISGLAISLTRDSMSFFSAIILL